MAQFILEFILYILHITECISLPYYVIFIYIMAFLTMARLNLRFSKGETAHSVLDIIYFLYFLTNCCFQTNL